MNVPTGGGDTEATRNRPSRRDRALALVVPVVLSVLAVVQIVRVHELDQSPWSGAGFGMFAQIDGETTRAVRAYSLRDGAEAPLAMPAELRRAAFELATVPTEGRARTLGDRWRELSEDARDAPVAVEVSRVTLEGDELTVTIEPMLQVVVQP